MDLHPYVIDLNNNTNLTIEGFWNEDKIKYFEILIYKCTDLSHCNSIQVINDYIDKGVYFNMYNLDYNIEFQYYTTPFSEIFAKSYFLIDNGLSKVYYNYLFKTEFHTDVGSVFSDFYNLTHYYNNGFMHDLLSYNQTKELNYSDIAVIHTSRETIKYLRSYIKITTVLANIGGVRFYSKE